MSIIIEGPDGAGKTTLIKQLLEDLPGVTLAERFCSSTEGPVDDLFMAAAGSVSQWSSSVIFDRHPLWSEYIYSHELGRPIADGFLSQGARSLTTAMHHQCMVVVCLPPLERVRANLSAEGQMPGVVENIDRIYEAYMVRLAQYTGRAGLYDYTDAPSYFDLLTSLKDNL